MDHWPQLYQRYHLDDVEVILFKLKNTFLKQKKVILKLKHVSMPEYWYYFTQCCCSRSYLIFSKRDLFWRWRGPTFETWKVPFWTKKRYLFESKRYLFQTKSTIFFNFVAQKGTCKGPFSPAEKWCSNFFLNIPRRKDFFFVVFFIKKVPFLGADFIF